MGMYNGHTNAMKIDDCDLLERNIKYAKDVLPSVAELAEAGAQQALVKLQKTFVD
jgi:hypothetical protein